MVEFRELHKNQLILEILFVKNLNDNQDEIDKLYNAIWKIKPNRIDLNTIHRPPAYDVSGVSYEFLVEVANKFKNLPVTIAHTNKTKKLQSFTEDEILNLLKLRPLTLEDIENLFDQTSQNLLQELIKNSKIKQIKNNNVLFFVID